MRTTAFIAELANAANAVLTGLPRSVFVGIVEHVSTGRVQRTIPVPSPLDAAMPVVALAAVGAALAEALRLGLSFGIGVPLVFLVIAAKRSLDASARRAHLRRLADDWLVRAAWPNPDAFAWRVDELLGSERKSVARVFRAYADAAGGLRPSGAIALNTWHLRRDAELLGKVADALDDDRCIPRARAVVRARDLVTDPGSPLHSSARHAELRETLEEILADTADASQRAHGDRVRLFATSRRR